MGRGRQKAKNTKIARDIKYSSPDINLGALQRDLSSKRTATGVADDWIEPNYDDVAEKYGNYLDNEDESED